jgi:hypothetical protein
VPLFSLSGITDGVVSVGYASSEDVDAQILDQRSQIMHDASSHRRVTYIVGVDVIVVNESARRYPESRVWACHSRQYVRCHAVGVGRKPQDLEHVSH